MCDPPSSTPGACEHWEAVIIISGDRSSAPQLGVCVDYARRCPSQQAKALLTEVGRCLTSGHGADATPAAGFRSLTQVCGKCRVQQCSCATRACERAGLLRGGRACQSSNACCRGRCFAWLVAFDQLIRNFQKGRDQVSSRPFDGWRRKQCAVPLSALSEL